MNDFVNKWFPPQKPNLVAKYDKDFIPPAYAYKKSMDRLKEIDRKLDLLHEYLAYRSGWLIIDSGIQHKGVNKDEPRLILVNTADLRTFDQFVKDREFVEDFMDKMRNT